MRFFICGSALRGQPDHGNLGDATFLGEATTAPRYRLHSVDDRHPGIYEVAEGGIAIAGELYEFTDEQHARLLASEPPDLYEAPVVLADGSSVHAMIYPQALIRERSWRDISHYGGWAAFRADAGAN
jgi:gamma-glutamylaminecyclotransferase